MSLSDQQQTTKAAQLSYNSIAKTNHPIIRETTSNNAKSIVNSILGKQTFECGILRVKLNNKLLLELNGSKTLIKSN